MKALCTLLAAFAVALVGCGSNENQAGNRNNAPKDGWELLPPPRVVGELDGTYQTQCKDGVLKTIVIRGKAYAYKAEKFEKKDCTGKSKVEQSLEASIDVKPSNARNGFTHEVTFDEGKGAVYTLFASVAPGTLKFEGEGDVYRKK
jgi:ABC-type Fe3+-hydroxamate transport system substrate-binding protein